MNVTFITFRFGSLVFLWVNIKTKIESTLPVYDASTFQAVKGFLGISSLLPVFQLPLDSRKPGQSLRLIVLFIIHPKNITPMRPENIVIKKTFEFIFNFSMDVFDIAWPTTDESILNRHLHEKFEGCCSRDGYASANAIMSFMCELSESNRMKFCKAIDQYLAQHDQEYASSAIDQNKLRFKAVTSEGLNIKACSVINKPNHLYLSNEAKPGFWIECKPGTLEVVL